MDSRSLAPQTLQASKKTMWDPLCFIFTCFCHVNKDLVPDFVDQKEINTIYIYKYIRINHTITPPITRMNYRNHRHHRHHRKRQQQNEWFFLRRSCHSSFRKEQRKAAELEALKSVARAQEPRIWKWNDKYESWVFIYYFKWFFHNISFVVSNLVDFVDV